MSFISRHEAVFSVPLIPTADVSRHKQQQA